MFTARRWVGLAAVLSAMLVAGLPAALADHPTPDQMTSVRRLAHQLEQEVSDFNRNAVRLSRTGLHSDRRALQDLDRLEDAAIRFHEEVENSMAYPAQTEAAWIDLEDTFDRAERSLPGLSTYGYLANDFERLGRTLSRLRDFYEGTAGGGDVVQIAGDLQSAAHSLYRTAQGASRWGDFTQRSALSRIRAFSESAIRFNDRVAHAGVDPALAGAEFRRLEIDFQRVEAAISEARFPNRVRSEFDRTREIFLQLQGAYGTTPSPWRRPYGGQPDDWRRFFRGLFDED